MAKKRKSPEPDPDGILRTGIYERNLAPPPKATAAEIKAALKGLESLAGIPGVETPEKLPKPVVVPLPAPRPSIRDWFDQWRTHLAEVIRPHVWQDEQPQPQTSYKALNLGAGYRWYGLSPEAPEIVHDAINAMNELRVLEHHIDADDAISPQGELAWVVQFSYKLGRIVERMQVRPFEPLAMIGRKVQGGGKQGADIVNADHAELHSQYQTEVASLMANGMKYYPATDEVGKRLGVNGRTVRKYAPRSQ